MELSPKQQATELIRDSERILLLTHDRPDSDALGSILALGQILTKLGKTVGMVASGTVLANMHFLPGIDTLKSELTNMRDFVISLDTSAQKIEKIMYKRENDNKLNIILSPQGASLLSADLVSFTEGTSQWQLIIVLDCADLGRIGPMQEQNAELFYTVPLINIDHHAGNDYFGKVNLVDLTATSTSEILVSLIESLGRDKQLLDEESATCLLTGIMGDTGSFQNSNTTPKSFTVAAQLVAAGARQQEIVRNMFKTKPLSTLRLWGKALAHLHDEAELKFVWSAVSEADIQEVGAEAEETSGVIDELLKSAANVDFALLLSDRNGEVHGSVRAAQKGVDVSEIAALFNGGGHAAAAAFNIPDATLADQQSNIIFKVKQYQAKRMQKDTI